MEINRPSANGASSRHGDPRSSGTGHQRSQHQARSSHGFHHVVGSFGRVKVRGFNSDGSVLNLQLRPCVLQQVLHGRDISYLRDAVQGHWFAAKQTGGQRGKRGVFRTANAHLATQGGTPLYLEFVHKFLVESQKSRVVVLYSASAARRLPLAARSRGFASSRESFLLLMRIAMRTEPACCNRHEASW